MVLLLFGKPSIPNLIYPYMPVMKPYKNPAILPAEILERPGHPFSLDIAEVSGAEAGAFPQCICSLMAFTWALLGAGGGVGQGRRTAVPR